MSRETNPRTPATPVALVAACVWMWFAMMLIHELGHVAAAWATGATLTSLELRPGPIAHTLARPNPHPSVVVWGGFVVGWLAPQLTAPWWALERGLVGPVLRAWAAFCLLAGGCYLAIGGGDRFTDTGLLRAVAKRVGGAGGATPVTAARVARGGGLVGVRRRVVRRAVGAARVADAPHERPIISVMFVSGPSNR